MPPPPQQANSPGSWSPALLCHLPTPFLGPGLTAPILKALATPFPGTGLGVWIQLGWIQSGCQTSQNRKLANYFLSFWMGLSAKENRPGPRHRGLTGIHAVPKPGLGWCRVREDDLLWPPIMPMEPGLGIMEEKDGSVCPRDWPQMCPQHISGKTLC